LFDRIGRADFGASWPVAMHTDRWNGRDRMLTVEELQVNHCMTAMGFAFRARVDAGLAANATRRINEKCVI